VRYAKDWPDAHTLAAHVGARVIKVKRPKHYFDPDNPKWPEELGLRLEMPVALELDYGSELARGSSPRLERLRVLRRETFDATAASYGRWWCEACQIVVLERYEIQC
jgi:hypothetical protein